MTFLEKLDAWRSLLPARFEMIGILYSEIDALIAVAKAASYRGRQHVFGACRSDHDSDLCQDCDLLEALERLNATLPGGE